MEIELKYLASKETAGAIFKELSPQLKDERKIRMHAVYFDTPARDLRKVHVAVRVRREDGAFVATAKWGGGSSDGLHKREEVNVTLPISKMPTSVTRELFYGTSAYDVIGVDQEFIRLVEMDFLRTEYHLDTGESVSAISYDEGFIHGIEKDVQISEIEIEFLEGNQKNMLEIGENLRKKYGIEPCNESKLARGLATKGEI